MKKSVKVYRTGATRVKRKFFLFPKRVGASLCWGWVEVKQNLFLAYPRSKGVESFGEIVPSMERIWLDECVLEKK